MLRGPIFLLPESIQRDKQIQRIEPGAKAFIVAPGFGLDPSIQLRPPERRVGGEGSAWEAAQPFWRVQHDSGGWYELPAAVGLLDKPDGDQPEIMAIQGKPRAGW